MTQTEFYVVVLSFLCLFLFGFRIGWLMCDRYYGKLFEEQLKEMLK